MYATSFIFFNSTNNNLFKKCQLIPQVFMNKNNQTESNIIDYTCTCIWKKIVTTNLLIKFLWEETNYECCREIRYCTYFFIPQSKDKHIYCVYICNDRNIKR